MPNYLPSMLEVPIVEGQSEDICGQDDRFYHFGLWTDYCGISINQMRQYNTFPNDPKDDGYPYKPSEGHNVISYDVTGTTVAFESQFPVTSFVTLTVEYDYTDGEGVVRHESVSTKMQKDSSKAEALVVLPEGIEAYDITNVKADPERDAWYYYDVKRRKPDIDIHKAFRFSLVNHLTDDSEILTTEYLSEMVKGDFHSGETITMQLSIGNTHGPKDDVDRDVEFKTDIPLIPVEGLNDMSDEDAAIAIEENAADIIFAVDTDIEEWMIKDEFGDDIETPEHLFNSIGTFIYDGETYRMLRYENPEVLSLAYDPATTGITRRILITFTIK